MSPHLILGSFADASVELVSAGRRVARVLGFLADHARREDVLPPAQERAGQLHRGSRCLAPTSMNPVQSAILPHVVSIRQLRRYPRSSARVYRQAQATMRPTTSAPHVTTLRAIRKPQSRFRVTRLR